ncbi:MAG: polysulfide reductase NrfD [Ignavibacteriales bacterium]|nr:polysulfide reductase NrfD [Ignavibacteriales bacterium]
MLKGKISKKNVNDFVSKLSFGGKIVWALALFGIILVLYRYVMGLGAATNLSDGYPWGLWIGFDILAGIALAAGGFVMAGTVHLFGGHKYHALSRPAILTALLGYLLFIFGLLFDLGRPWNLWRAIYSWNHLLLCSRLPGALCFIQQFLFLNFYQLY